MTQIEDEHHYTSWKNNFLLEHDHDHTDHIAYLTEENTQQGEQIRKLTKELKNTNERNEKTLEVQ